MHTNEMDIRHILDVHGNALYRSAYLLLGNPHDVQDALQEVLLRFLEKTPSFASAEHERAWLPAPEQQAHLEELYELPAKWKSVLILHYFEGYSVAEIAKILRLSESAVKKRLQRGREALKLVLSEAETIPELLSGNAIQTLNKLNGRII